MFKYRQSERTPSASISQDLLIKDFGSDLSTDVIGFVMESRGVNFIDAVNYIKDFIGGVA
jgi:DNA primase